MKIVTRLMVAAGLAGVLAMPAYADGPKKGKSEDAYGQAVRGAEGKDAKKDAAKRHYKEKMKEMEEEGRGKFHDKGGKPEKGGKKDD